MSRGRKRRKKRMGKTWMGEEEGRVSRVLGTQRRV
jgi:hypothetical protein